ncbi:DoxX family protein [Oceanobacillus senegalensis]|uniref:DoxX family protein n=1 Tax=Oceanobacillus senegalensis TaxID=1936063 RepID=UPI000A313316|nr:DoxX family protein [Oceanobacillus senegalensis]
MLLIIIQILLALMFLIAGLPKFTSDQHKESFKNYGYPQWFRIFTAIVEVGIAALLIIGIWNQQLAAIGGFLVIATMIGAIFTHIKCKDSFKNIVLPIVLLVLGVSVFLQKSSAFLG